MLVLAAKYDWPDGKPGEISRNDYMCSGWILNSGAFKNKGYLCSIYNCLRTTQERKYEDVHIDSSTAIAPVKLWHYALSLPQTCLPKVSLKKLMLPSDWRTVMRSLCNSVSQIHQTMSMRNMAGSASVFAVFIGATQYPVNTSSKSVLPFADRLGDPRPHLCVLLALWFICNGS